MLKESTEQKELAMQVMTAKELQQKMLDHIEQLRKDRADPDISERILRMINKSVLREVDGEDLLRFEQFVRSFRTE
jgi:hypothetical protein